MRLRQYRAVGRGAGDQPGGSARQGPTRGLRQVMARHRLVIIHATWTFIEPIAVGGGIGSPCSRNDWMCRGIASAMRVSTSSRERPAATQPGRSGTYAPQASPSCSITTTYSVTILPSRLAGLPPDRPQRTLRHLITRLACHRHRSRPVGMAELAMRAGLPVEAPAVTLQSADHVSYLHEFKVRDRCDDLLEPSPSRGDRRSRTSRRGRLHRAKLLVVGLAGAPSLPEGSTRRGTPRMRRGQDRFATGRERGGRRAGPSRGAQPTRGWPGSSVQALQANRNCSINASCEDPLAISTSWRRTATRASISS
jgi:hypothetical protein